MSANQILIGGGTGFIGKRLAKLLSKSYDVTLVSRMPGFKRITWHELDSKGLPGNNTKAVINLAGQNVLDPSRRWTSGFKQNVWNSRINTTAALVRAISKSGSDNKIVFINISGVSLYPNDDKEHDETEAGSGFDFMSKLCLEWEKAATIPDTLPLCRSVKIRTGVVLGREGGMIKNLYVPFFFGMGGPVGKGQQILPWIHIDDLCNLVKYSIENEQVSGVLNGTAPEIATNLDFTKQFARALRRPALVPVPEFVFELIFGKERSVLLTNGAKVLPKRTQSLGFKFQYPTMKSACEEVVR